ncbi:hypothetical protein D3C72_2060570 [compost metagenome]
MRQPNGPSRLIALEAEAVFTDDRARLHHAASADGDFIPDHDVMQNSRILANDDAFSEHDILAYAGGRMNLGFGL